MKNGVVLQMTGGRNVQLDLRYIGFSPGRLLSLSIYIYLYSLISFTHDNDKDNVGGGGSGNGIPTASQPA